MRVFGSFTFLFFCGFLGGGGGDEVVSYFLFFKVFLPITLVSVFGHFPFLKQPCQTDPQVLSALCVSFFLISKICPHLLT